MNNIRKSKNLAILLTGGIILSGCGHNNVLDVVITDNDLQTECIISDDSFDFDNSVNISDLGNVVTSSVNYSVHTDTSTTSTLDTTSDFVTQTTSQVESVDTSTSLVISSSIDYDKMIGNAAAEVVKVTTSVADTTVEDDPIDICTCNKLKYKYESDISSYVLKDGYTLDSLCDELGMTSSLILAMNPNFDELKVGDCINYPIKKEIYMAKQGESIDNIYFETGVMGDIIRELNNISTDVNVLLEDTPLVIHIFKGNETSYETPFGISNVYFDNKIWGDKIVSATGFSGASQKILVLNNSRLNHGMNSATMYCFDGASNYTSSCIASNVKDIGLIDGCPVAYRRYAEDFISLADEVGLSLNSELYQRWSTIYLQDYCEEIDSDGYAYVYYSSPDKTYIKK